MASIPWFSSLTSKFCQYIICKAQHYLLMTLWCSTDRFLQGKSITLESIWKVLLRLLIWLSKGEHVYNFLKPHLTGIITFLLRKSIEISILKSNLAIFPIIVLRWLHIEFYLLVIIMTVLLNILLKEIAVIVSNSWPK